MSAGLPYLQKLRKSDLTEFAETTDLPDYEGLKKSDLEVALDNHLRANASTYSKEASLSDYYKRLGPRSPVKKAIEQVKAEAEPVIRKARRKTSKFIEEAQATSDTDNGLVSSLIKTPGQQLARASASFAKTVPLPPSPSVVTDTIERQTRRLSHTVSDYYTRSRIHEYADFTRDLLSGHNTLNAIALIAEAFSLRSQILTSKPLVEVPAIPYLKESRTLFYVPDLFLLLGHSYWAPFTLWLMTSLLLPLTAAYFVNYPLKHAGHTHPTRRAAAIRQQPTLQFDPVVFNLAKAVLAYLVYKHGFDFGGLVNAMTIEKVNGSIYGGWGGMMTAAGVGGVVSLWEGILSRK